ncbi:MAG: maltose alpha-D-glucosyltransferase [Oscillatoriales cyanobacterium]|nr:MAG: maltose alpha-D-glucosyltransferase [Oscillatoriales cyanobacterium]
MPNSMLNNDPLWFKDAIIYEVPIRAFADSNADGIGDFRGLTEKLTLEDFKELLEAAHQRGIRVIIELIVNHTSDQHAWFQRARRAPKGSNERDFYVWSDTPEKYQDARIIFQDFETSNWAWDPVAKAYYWHRFYAHQPDLNYDNPAVRQAILDVVDFWLELGVDGLRMDAVPYLYEREGTNCENLPETHVFLKHLRKHVDEKFPNRMLLAEANQWPEDAVEYYAGGDECHMNFHFPLMPRLFMALHMEDSFPISDILQQTPHIPNNCQWALFLRNHDELTLEMVSDEDRDYMYRVYAQDTQARINLGIRRRLAPLMGNNRRRIELMNALLLSLPGTPVLYYGDEIGMGDNIYLGDRNGVRTPMQWSSDRNAGFSRANPQRLYAPPIVDPEYHYESVNVEAQRANPSSLWWWMKRLIAVRQRFQAFGRGTCEFLYPENRKVLAFVRTYQDEHILVVANLSRFVQTAELDLSPFKNAVPVEIFGRAEFPAVGEDPYFLSLSPHTFYWFTLTAKPEEFSLHGFKTDLPSLAVIGNWKTAFATSQLSEMLLSLLPNYLRSSRWFIGADRTIQSLEISEIVPVECHNSAGEESTVYILFLLLNYTEGMPETYVLPVGWEELKGDADDRAIARLHFPESNEAGVLFDAAGDKGLLTALLRAIANSRSYKGTAGQLVGIADNIFSSDQDLSQLEPHLFKKEQSNTSAGYGDRYVLKILRKVEEGINPELEIGRFLTDRNPIQHYAPIAGALEYHTAEKQVITVGILQKLIPDSRDAWSYTLDTLRDYFEQVMTVEAKHLGDNLSTDPENYLPSALTGQMRQSNSLVADLSLEIPALARELIGSYLASAELLGQRTAELHLALASDTENAAFAPENFTSFYQRSIYQHMRNMARRTLLLLKKRLSKLPPEAQKLAQNLLNREELLMERFKSILNLRITADRIRCHGDFHFGQVLYTGKDFVIIDFGGERNRPLSERRMKRSPLRDVAGMLQSFNYAVTLALRNEVESGMIRPENLPEMQQWANVWHRWVSLTFLNSYLVTAADASFLPKSIPELQVLLDAYILEKGVAELAYELNYRLDWAEIPMKRILQLLNVNRKP